MAVFQGPSGYPVEWGSVPVEMDLVPVVIAPAIILAADSALTALAHTASEVPAYTASEALGEAEEASKRNNFCMNYCQQIVAEHFARKEQPADIDDG
jgi:hypothetical protein